MRIVKIVFILLVILVLAGAGFSYWLFSSLNAARDHTKAAAYITIEKGSSPSQIIDKLVAEDILPGSNATMFYLRTLGDASKLQAGEFQFPSPVTPLQALKILEKGEDRTIRLTIPEGFTRYDIAKRIVEKFPPKNGITEAGVLAMMDDISLIKDISPTAKNLEGYMYPSTYNLPRDTGPQEIIVAMVGQFKKVWKTEYNERARQIGRTPHEIVTLASLIETETGVESERPIVAGVINNRLSKNMALGIDQTNVYIAKMMGRWDGTINKSDLEVDSPYNTRIKTGIPPGPISSVSESAIKAALNPQAHDYIFYVRNVEANDGSHWFYASAAEFEKGKAKYQQWLEEERQKKRAAEGN